AERQQQRLGSRKRFSPLTLPDPHQQPPAAEGTEHQESHRTEPGRPAVPMKSRAAQPPSQEGGGAITESQNRPPGSGNLQAIPEENEQDEDREGVEENPGMEETSTVPGSHQAISPFPRDPGRVEDHGGESERRGEPPGNPSEEKRKADHGDMDQLAKDLGM